MLLPLPYLGTEGAQRLAEAISKSVQGRSQSLHALQNKPQSRVPRASELGFPLPERSPSLGVFPQRGWERCSERGPPHTPPPHSPLCLFHVLQIEEQRRDDLVHVLWVPDVGLQLIIHRLPHDPLQAFDARHSDSVRKETEAAPHPERASLQPGEEHSSRSRDATAHKGSSSWALT